MYSPVLKEFVFSLIFFIALSSGGKAQVLSEIRFEGLKKTEKQVLERHIDSRVGAKPDLKQILVDVQQLQNLVLISKASHRLDTLNNNYILVFEIEEAITLFPILNFGGVKNNVWFQAGFKELNLKGNQLAVLYQNNDKRHNGNLFFKIPYLGKSKWGTSISLVQWASVEPLYFRGQAVFYDYDNANVGLSLIRRLNRKHTLEFGTTYFVEKYVKNARHKDEFTPGPEQARLPKLLFKLIYQANYLSYHYLYLTGWDFTVNTQRIWNIDDKSPFDIIFSDTRYFKKTGTRNNLAARLRMGISTNNDSPFAPFVLDSHVNIRGVGNRIDRGTAMLIFNLEYRQFLFELDRFAFQAVGFSDIGTWRQPGGGLHDLVDADNLVYFGGGGLRLIYKKAHNAVLRIDYGIGLINSRGNGFVLGLGQYF